MAREVVYTVLEPAKLMEELGMALAEAYEARQKGIATSMSIPVGKRSTALRERNLPSGVTKEGMPQDAV